MNINLVTDPTLDVRIVNSCAFVNEYHAILPDGSQNPVTKVQFFKQCLYKTMRDWLLTAESAQAARIASDNAIANVPDATAIGS